MDQLEEDHRDLAEKYLGIPVTYFQGRIMQVSEIAVPKDKEIHELISKEKYEEAIPQLKNLIIQSKNNEELYNAISWCYYETYDYKNASIYIDLALKNNPKSIKSKSIKGCILAEEGIETKSKTKLLLAKDIFSDLIKIRKDWMSYYNLANTLSALGEYEKAKKIYIKALKQNNKVAEIWKNLGTCYFHLGDHRKELVCMDTALSINPQKSQALMSKGVTLGVVYERYADGLNLINSALENDKSLAYHWPVAYYWKAKFLSNLNEIQKALKELDEGLVIAPDNVYLLNLKAQILSRQWRIDQNYLLKAAEFFELRIRMYERELQTIRELALIYHKLGRDDEFLDYSLKLINLVAELLHQFSDEDIKNMNINYNISNLIENIWLYSRYRKFRPINEYINYFDKEFWYELDKIFWLFFGYIFSNTCDTIRKSKEWKELSWNDISKQNELLFIELIPLITKKSAKNVTMAQRKKGWI